MFDPTSPPEFAVSKWFNSQDPITLAGLKGKVVVVEAFQMLCPGCVSHGLPQAQRIHKRFSRDDVAVIGLHTVFEHHEAMTPTSLEAFLYEYRIRFPVGVDEQLGKGIPKTMLAYEMRGTPTLLIFDRAGRLRRHYFGQHDDMVLGAEIVAMVLETDAVATERKLRSIFEMEERHGEHDEHVHGPGCGCH